MLDGPIRIEIGGTGAVRYRCATCALIIEGEPVLVEGLTYHTEHTPEEPDGA